MTAVTISGISATPWSFYDTSNNEFDNSIYNMMNQFAIATNQIKTQSAALQDATTLINTNNQQLAMLNEPWTDQSLFPWPTDPAEALKQTAILQHDGILPQYQYDLSTNLPTGVNVFAPATTSYGQPTQALTLNAPSDNEYVMQSVSVTITNPPNQTYFGVDPLSASGTNPIPTYTGTSQIAIPTGANAITLSDGSILSGNTPAGTTIRDSASGSVWVVAATSTSPPNVLVHVSTWTTSFTDPGAAINVMPVPAGATLPPTPPATTGGALLSSAATGTAVTASNGSIWVLATTSNGSELIRATSSLYTSVYDQYAYTLPTGVTPPANVTVSSTNPQTYYAAPPISNAQLLSLTDAQLSPAPVFPVSSTSPLSSLNNEPLGTAVYVGPTSNNDIWVLAQNAGGQTILMQPQGTPVPFVLNPSLSELETWNSQYAQGGTVVPPWPTGLASTTLIDDVMNGETIETITGNKTAYVNDDNFSASNIVNDGEGTSIGAQGDNPGNFSTVSTLSANIDGGAQYWVENLNTTDTDVAQEANLINYSLNSLNGFAVGNGFTTGNANDAVLPSNQDATTIANNMQTLQSEGVITNSVNVYDALGYGNPPVAGNTALAVNQQALYNALSAAGQLPTWTTSTFYTPDTVQSSGAAAVDDTNRTSNTGVSKNYTTVPSDPPLLSSADFTTLTGSGMTAAAASSAGLSVNEIMQTADGTYVVLVPSGGNVQALVLTGLQWNPTTSQVTDWTNQLGGAVAMEKTQTLLTNNQNTTVTPPSDAYDSMAITYTPPGATNSITQYVLNSNVNTTLDTVNSNTSDLPTVSVPTVCTVLSTFSDASGNAATDANGDVVSTTLPASSTTDGATSEIVVYPNGKWVWASSITPYIGQPTTTTIQALQSDYVNLNTGLSNDGQNEQLQLQALFAIITEASQGVSTLITSWVSTGAAIDPNI